MLGHKRPRVGHIRWFWALKFHDPNAPEPPSSAAETCSLGSLLKALRNGHYQGLREAGVWKWMELGLQGMGVHTHVHERGPLC